MSWVVEEEGIQTHYCRSALMDEGESCVAGRTPSAASLVTVQKNVMAFDDQISYRNYPLIGSSPYNAILPYIV